MCPTRPKVQTTIEHTKEISKEVDQIHFSIESVREIYDDWVNTKGFNNKKVFSIEGIRKPIFLKSPSLLTIG